MVKRLDAVVFPAWSTKDIDELVTEGLCNKGQFALPFFGELALYNIVDLRLNLLKVGVQVE